LIRILLGRAERGGRRVGSPDLVEERAVGRGPYDRHRAVLQEDGNAVAVVSGDDAAGDRGHIYLRADGGFRGSPTITARRPAEIITGTMQPADGWYSQVIRL
jgi:hypothetical protein